MNTATSQINRSAFPYQRWIKWGLLPLLCMFVLYHSVYFRKLSTLTNADAEDIDFTLLADSLYHQAILKRAYDLSPDQLLTDFAHNPDSTMAKYGNRLGIGQSSFFMITVKGTATDKTEAGFVIQTDKEAYYVDVKYIFGNAIRDASGLVKLTDYKTNTEFNKLSEALNDLIREKVIPPLLTSIKNGDQVKVTGALKLSKKAKEELSIQPVSIVNLSE